MGDSSAWPVRVAVIIPALDEEAAIADVVRSIPTDVPGAEVVRVVVVDNGSADATGTAARNAGATVVVEPKRGYGRACLAGLAALRSDHVDIVAFMDGDGADDPSDLVHLLRPLIADTADLVIGSRVLGAREGRAEPGALLPQARFGNWLACFLIRLRWGAAFTDLGPLRAVRWRVLDRLDMSDPTYGWTVEMQAKAARDGLQYREIPVAYRRRVGKSKISGTIKGSVKAGGKILWTIGRLAASGGSRKTLNRNPRRVM